jgi:isopenicillin-N epimerase
MAAIALPDDPTPRGPESPLYLDPLQERLFGEFRFEVPVVPWPNPPHRLLRLSAQLYNHLGEYRRLAAALLELLGGRRK